jgi:hypothetical protein
MTAFSQTATPSVFFGHNATVKAWCLVSSHSVSGTPTQTQFDATNFIDGYNMLLDVGTQTAQPGNVYSGALKFSFLTPMTNTKYKVFLQSYGNSTSFCPVYAHVLNSIKYPKTTTSFWVRTGFTVGTTVHADPTRVTNQVGTVRLWSNASVKMGVVVL